MDMAFVNPTSPKKIAENKVTRLNPPFCSVTWKFWSFWGEAPAKCFKYELHEWPRVISKTLKLDVGKVVIVLCCPYAPQRHHDMPQAFSNSIEAIDWPRRPKRKSIEDKESGFRPDRIIGRHKSDEPLWWAHRQLFVCCGQIKRSSQKRWVIVPACMNCSRVVSHSQKKLGLSKSDPSGFPPKEFQVDCRHTKIPRKSKSTKRLAHW